MKKIISVILSLALTLSIILGTNINLTVAAEYDPYGTSAFGPSAPDTDAQFYNASRVSSVTCNEKSIELRLGVTYLLMPVYITLPTLGGIRLYGENKGGFDPESLIDIEYIENSVGNISFKTADNSIVALNYNSSSFNISVSNSNGVEVTAIGSQQIKFGLSSDSNGYTLAKMYLEMPLSQNEKIYGTGERFNGLDQVGKRTYMWNVDCGYHSSQAEDAELWRGYKNVPIFHSSKGYTLFYDSYYSAKVDVGYTQQDKLCMDFNGPEFDVYLWQGSVLDNIEKYTDLTGKSILPPKWAFRYIAGEGTSYWNSTGNMAAKLEDDLQSYASLGTPDIAAVYVEGNEYSGDSATAEIYDVCESYDTRYLRWNKPDPDRATIETLLPDVDSNDIPIVKDSVTGGDSGSFIDFTSPYSGELMTALMKKYINKGLCGGLLDFGELIQTNTIFKNGKNGNEMHNYYSYVYAKAYHDVFSSNANDGFITFARAACAGSQTCTALFSGDQSADFTGLKRQLSAGLSVSASGFSVWGGDIAGYEGTPTSEVYCRGLAMSTFYPVMRAHGTASRNPWSYGENGITTFVKYYWLRENLLNAIYSAAIKSSKTGLPMMRALALQYQDDEYLADIEDEYIFCEDMLVAPVLTQGAASRSVTFPQGKWYGLLDGSVVNGNQTVSVAAGITEIPVYLRSGAVVPVSLSQSLKLTDNMNSGSVEALLVTPTDNLSEVIFYKDENTSLQYTLVPCEYGFSIQLSSGNEATAIIAYDTKALNVKADGIALPQLSVAPTATDTGYYIAENGSTVISLGSSARSYIEIITDNTDFSTRIWDFSSSAAIKDFDAYMNDAVYGYEKQNREFRWLKNSNNSYITANAWMCSNENRDKIGNTSMGRWGGIICSSYSSLSPCDITLKNFETTMVFQMVYSGDMGTMSIGFRESTPGKHTNLSNGDNWNMGYQSGLVTVLNNNLIWCDSLGVKQLEATVQNVDFKSGFYALKLRAVGNSLTISIYDETQTTLYFQNQITLPDSLNKPGTLSYYGYSDCCIKGISITALDSHGNPTEYFNSSNAKEWNFSDSEDLNDFEAYLNSTTYGYEQQKTGERWSYNYSGGNVASNNVIYSNSNKTNCSYGGVICSANMALTPKNVKLRNFETTVKYKISTPEGAWGAISVGFRETYAGLHTTLKKGDSWYFGIQYGGKYSALVTALQKSTIWVDCATKLKETSVSNADFTAGYYIMKVRVVESICTVSIYTDDKSLLYTDSFTLPERLAEYGVISYYSNNSSVISNISLTELDNNGSPVDLKHYQYGDCDFNGVLNSCDISLLKTGLLTDVMNYGFDVNRDCFFDVRDLVSIKKYSVQ